MDFFFFAYHIWECRFLVVKSEEKSEIIFRPYRLTHAGFTLANRLLYKLRKFPQSEREKPQFLCGVGISSANSDTMHHSTEPANQIQLLIL